MPDRFEICHPITAGWEGGWSNHRDDPGGATMYGVIQKVYDAYRKSKGLPLQSVRLITRAEALEIFRTEYWIKSGADKLFPGVDLAVYDASVNSGVSRGKKWLASVSGLNDPSEMVRRICKARLAFVKALKIWATFGKGWARRIADIEAKGVVMALEAMNKSKTEVKAIVSAHIATAEKDAQTAAKQTKAAGAGAVASPSVGVVQADAFTTTDWMILAGITIAFVGLVVWLVNSRRENNERAAAYREVLA